MKSERNCSRDKDLWSCLTCGRCFERCPTNINFPEFMRNLREEAAKRALRPTLTHHGILQSIMDFQAAGVKQKKTDWAREAGKIAETGEVFYFVGCMPYFSVIFRDIGVDSLSIGRNVIKILNASGVTPVVSDEETCCGHDMLWNGNPETFKKLAAKNIELIRRSGAKKVVFSCPEGYYTFKHHYPQYFRELGFEVVHFYDFVGQMIADGALKLSDGARGYTYHDPCRLGRMAKIYESPRSILEQPCRGPIQGDGAKPGKFGVLRHNRLGELFELLEANSGRTVQGSQSHRGAYPGHRLSEMPDSPELRANEHGRYGP